MRREFGLECIGECVEVEEVEAIVYGFNCTVFGGRFEGIEVENVKVKWLGCACMSVGMTQWF